MSIENSNSFGLGQYTLIATNAGGQIEVMFNATEASDEGGSGRTTWQWVVIISGIAGGVALVFMFGYCFRKYRQGRGWRHLEEDQAGTRDPAISGSTGSPSYGGTGNTFGEPDDYNVVA